MRQQANRLFAFILAVSVFLSVFFPYSAGVGHAEGSSVATLSGLTLSNGVLSPAFSSNTAAYQAHVINVSTLKVTPTVTDSTYAAVTVGGVPAVSGTPSSVSLTKGLNMIPIEVTAQDGVTKKLYTLQVTNGPAPAEGTVNLAAGKPIISASSSITNYGILTDGAKAIQVINASNGSTNFVLDLGAEHRLDDLIIYRGYSNISGHVMNAKIYGSNSPTFTGTEDVLGGIPSSANIDLTTNVTEVKVSEAYRSNSYRYIKFEKKDGWASALQEFEVYGYPQTQIANTNIQDGATGVPATTDFIIDFNVPMDTSTFTPANVILRENGTIVTYTPVFSGTQYRIPSSAFKNEMEYQVTIGTGLKAWNGTPLASGRTITYTTGEGEQSAYYIAPNGDDGNSGTIDAPFRTLDGARKALRPKLPTMTVNYSVYLREGVYNQSTSVNFDEKDSGMNGFTVTYEAYPGEKPVIEGGRELSRSWEAAGNGIYRVKAEGIADMREFYVNDKRQQRASGMFHSAPASGKREVSILTSAVPIGGFKHPEDLQLYQSVHWRAYILPIDSASYDTVYSKLRFREPYMTTYLTKFNFDLGLAGFVRLENALELLDSPGEWYYDKRTQYLYYQPESGVDLNTAKLYTPQAASLLNLKGSSLANKIHDITFKGITFRGSTWMDVNLKGYAHTQSVIVANENGVKDLMPAAININHARNVTFERNIVRHIGRTGINMENGIRDIKVAGNLFYDISGGAIAIGSTDHNIIDSPLEELPTNIMVSNNVLREIGVEFEGAAAITSLYSENLSIVHNDIYGVNYSGISIGWGFSTKITTLVNTLVGNNKIVNFNRKTVDGGAIYSLSSHVNSYYRGNYVKDVNGSFNTGALYHDAQSTGFLDEDNVVESERNDYVAYNLNQIDDTTIRNLYTTTGNIVNFLPGPKGVRISDVHIYPDADWPAEARQIIDQAGLEAAYRDVLTWVPDYTQVAKPLVRSNGTNYIHSLSFEPRTAYVDRSLFDAPHLEENGLVSIEAKDYNGYVGLENADYSFIGIMNVLTQNVASKLPLMTHPKQFTGTPAKTGKPSVSYDIEFQTPGTYYLSIRGRDDSKGSGKVRIEFDQQVLGDMLLANPVGFTNQINGAPVTVQVSKPGIHTVKLTPINQGVVLFLDRIVLSQQLTDDIKQGSTVLGPLNSKKVGKTDVVIPNRHAFPSFPIPVETNYSEGKGTSSSSGTASHAVDNSIFTVWRSEAGDLKPYWQVDLLEPTSLYRIETVFDVFNDNPAERRNIEYLVSNDPAFGDYYKLGGIGPNGIPFKEAYSFKPEGLPEYRYVRIQKTVDNEPLALSEVRVLSPSPAAPTNVALGRSIVAISEPNQSDLPSKQGYLTDSAIATGLTVSPQSTGEAFVVVDLGYPQSIDELSLTRPNAAEPQQVAGATIFGSTDGSFTESSDVLAMVPADVAAGNTEWRGRAPYSTKTYRYIKISKNDGKALVLNEIELLSKPKVNPDDTFTNVALNKPIVEVPSRFEAELPAKKLSLTDGEATSWLMGGTNPNPYVVIDLGQPYKLDKISLQRFYITAPEHSRNIKIIGDADGDFSSGAEELHFIPNSYNDQTTDTWTGYIMNPTAFRYIKVAKQSTGDFYLREIRLLQKAEPSLDSLGLEGLSSAILSGSKQQQAKVTASYSNGSKSDVTEKAIYSSSNTAVATVNNEGAVNITGAGTAVIKAVFGGIEASYELVIADDLPPAITKTVDPVPNLAGWNRTDVKINLNAADQLEGSGVKSITYQIGDSTPVTVNGTEAAVTISAEGASTVTYSALDQAGNQSDPVEHVVKIDKTGPVIEVTGERTYDINEQVILRYTAADSLSGLTADSSTGDVLAQGAAYTFELGTRTYTVSAKDAAGNETVRTVNIDVKVTTAGFLELTRRFMADNGSISAEDINKTLEKLEKEIIKGISDKLVHEIETLEGKGLNRAQVDLLLGLIEEMEV
ncbi:OmpL47-type beta-barrel domain-containing protein [Paenibacillus sp. GCM10023252]|uniref:OmpL47-type beta-barrel domain-containing protein n=1 Tax=Paenibacillus sp. GCM10023252 TaxID=3252649 RepID=UPI0036222D21